MRKIDIIHPFFLTEFNQVVIFVNDFAAEVEALHQNQEFMEFLAQRSRSTKRLSLADARKRLGIRSSDFTVQVRRS